MTSHDSNDESTSDSDGHDVSNNGCGWRQQSEIADKRNTEKSWNGNDLYLL